MHPVPRHRLITAWLALLALVLGTLAPAVTQAVVAGSERAGWVQICSVSGMSWVQLEAGEDSAPQGSGASDGCTWCTAQAAGGLPPQPAIWLSVDVAAVAPPQGLASAVLARPWPAALGRAPPLL